MRSGWESYEVVCEDADGHWNEFPFSNALAFHRPQMASALRKMQIVQDLGFPEARRQMRLKKGGKAIVRADDCEPFLWMLKCTPQAWRLFFFTYENLDKNGGCPSGC